MTKPSFSPGGGDVKLSNGKAFIWHVRMLKVCAENVHHNFRLSLWYITAWRLLPLWKLLLPRLAKPTPCLSVCNGTDSLFRLCNMLAPLLVVDNILAFLFNCIKQTFWASRVLRFLCQRAHSTQPQCLCLSVCLRVFVFSSFSCHLSPVQSLRSCKDVTQYHRRVSPPTPAAVNYLHTLRHSNLVLILCMEL